MIAQVEEKRRKRRFNVPVIGHFDDGSYEFNSIIEAEEETGINYNLIFENCIGKIHSARGTYWEYVDGKNWIKYRSQYIRDVRKYTRFVGFNG